MADNGKLIQPIDADFDAVASAMVSGNGAQPNKVNVPDYAELIRELTLPRGWGVPVIDVVNQGQNRLDAEHYDPLVVENDRRLRSLGVELKPLSEFADVRLPSMFTRIWAKDDKYGVPYLNATDLMSYFALGIPAQERFLSHASAVNVAPLIVKSGMILITCSGTIGRVFDVPKALDGWAGTHDLVRIIPHDPSMKGFLRAYLTSQFAQIQILGHTHGGQIDHVTDDQVASCLVPVLDAATIKAISEIAVKADKMRSDALRLMQEARDNLTGALLK
jgi:type I restriction enzyme S subunit